MSSSFKYWKLMTQNDNMIDNMNVQYSIVFLNYETVTDFNIKYYKIDYETLQHNQRYSGF